MADARPTASVELDALRQGQPGLVPETGSHFALAAAVCLDHCGHPETVAFSVRGVRVLTLHVTRSAVSEQMRRGFADLQEATEDGACGLAILAVTELLGLLVIERSVRNTGFDYWLGEEPRSGRPLQRKARLEVSGLLTGSARGVAARVRSKLAQTRRSDRWKMDAYVVVVAFSLLTLVLEHRPAQA